MTELLQKKRRRGRPRKDGTNEETTDLPIIWQMMKTYELQGSYDTVFLNGERARVDAVTAKRVLDHNMDLRTSIEKDFFQKSLALSYNSFIQTVKEIEK